MDLLFKIKIEEAYELIEFLFNSSAESSKEYDNLLACMDLLNDLLED